MPLFDSEDLSTYVQYPVDDDAAAAAERVVSGWLQDATGPGEWYGDDVVPSQLPAQLYAWAIELGAMAHENPAGLASEITADKTTVWDRARRTEILDKAAAWAGQNGSTSSGGPVGRFPSARRWPDPAEQPCWPYGPRYP